MKSIDKVSGTVLFCIVSLMKVHISFHMIILMIHSLCTWLNEIFELCSLWRFLSFELWFLLCFVRIQHFDMFSSYILKLLTYYWCAWYFSMWWHCDMWTGCKGPKPDGVKRASGFVHKGHWKAKIQSLPRERIYSLGIG